jgi:hypothetical protein
MIVLTQSQLDVVGQLLGKAPYEVSAPILSSIQNQLNKAAAEKEKQPSTTKKPKK